MKHDTDAARDARFCAGGVVMLQNTHNASSGVRRTILLAAGYLGRSLVMCVVAATLWSCTSGQTASIPAVATPNIAQTSTLQFAVGTATIGTAGGASTLGLNVVATFRQPNGNNATGVNTPTLQAPAGMNFGPLLGNLNHVDGVTPAQLAALAGQVKAQPSPSATPYPLAASAANGFGPFVGVFGYGLAGDNLVSNADLGALLPLGAGNPVCFGIATSYIGAVAGSGGSATGSFYGSAPNTGVSFGASKTLPGDLVRSAELALPIPSGSNSPCTCPSTCAPLDTPFSDSAFPVQYFGGPPAWPSPQGYGNYSYFVGYPLGFTDFTATPVAGAYSLSVAYPTSSDYSTFGTITKTAQLPAAKVAAPLAAFPQPSLQVNADGSGVVSANVPAGVREAVITVVTVDCDLTGRGLTGVNYYNHYALVTKTTGPQTLFLSAALGPPSTVTGQPTHTFCTLDDVQAYNAIATANGTPGFTSFPITSVVAAVGFDYPAYESSYPFDTSAAPKITTGDGHTGQADITTSYPLTVLTSVAVPAAGS